MGLGDYNSGSLDNENQFRISPSGVSLLSDNEWKWYESNILKENIFTGNTASRLGTYTHYLIESFLKGVEAPKEDEVIQWLTQEGETDMWRIIDDGKAMFKAFKENYIRTNDSESEVWLEHSVSDRIKFSGTADIMFDDAILDIKTTAKKKSSIGDYWLQLYTLAFIARLQGKEINKVGVIYLVAPTKTLVARYVEIIEPIDEDRMDRFVEWLKLKAKKITYAIDNDMADVLLSRNLLSFRN